jgi:hypothetical protein
MFENPTTKTVFTYFSSHFKYETCQKTITLLHMFKTIFRVHMYLVNRIGIV